MNKLLTHLATLRKAIEAPTNGFVGIVDDVLLMCRENALQLDWRDNRCRLSSVGGEEAMVDLPLRKSIFRAILARVATLCDEQAAGTFAPYGGTGELKFGSDQKTILRASWVNTLAEQCLTIVPVNASSHSSITTAPQPIDATPRTGEALRPT